MLYIRFNEEAGDVNKWQHPTSHSFIPNPACACCFPATLSTALDFYSSQRGVCNLRCQIRGGEAGYTALHPALLFDVW